MHLSIVKWVDTINESNNKGFALLFLLQIQSSTDNNILKNEINLIGYFIVVFYLKFNVILDILLILLNIYWS